MKSALLLLCLGMLGCAGVCCGQTGKLPKCSIDGVTFFYEGADGLCHDPRSPQPTQRAVPIKKWVTTGTLSKFDSVSEPELMDIPALKEAIFQTNTDCAPLPDGTHGKSGQGCWVEPKYAYTCADKSRILLTAEDGTKHCIKFPK